MDGTKWEYFIDGKLAKSHREKNVLVKFTNEMSEAVKAGNADSKDSLIAAFQNVITGLTPITIRLKSSAKKKKN